MGQPQSTDQYSSIELSDRRRLGYAEYGVTNGKPVLYFHGAPGSSLIHATMNETAVKLGIRLIAVDRPGYGLSDPQPGRTLLSWADDVAALTHHLGLSQYAIAAFSGGTPFALACAFKYPERITKMALFSPLAPLDAPGATNGMSPLSSGLYALARSNPDELRATFASLASSPSAMLGAISSSASPWEQKTLHEHAAGFEAEYSRLLMGGVEGIASDFILYAGDWGFPLDRITTEVLLWSGSIDEYTPSAMTEYLSFRLSNARTFRLEGKGHYAVFEYWEEMLAKLA